MEFIHKSLLKCQFGPRLQQLKKTISVEHKIAQVFKKKPRSLSRGGANPNTPLDSPITIVKLSACDWWDFLKKFADCCQDTRGVVFGSKHNVISQSGDALFALLYAWE